MREKSFRAARRAWCFRERRQALKPIERWASALDRKSTRLNSSHSQISYAVFCLKKKKKHTAEHGRTDDSLATKRMAATHTRSIPYHHCLLVSPLRWQSIRPRYGAVPRVGLSKRN